MTIRDRFDDPFPDACPKCQYAPSKAYGAGHRTCPSCDHTWRQA